MYYVYIYIFQYYDSSIVQITEIVVHLLSPYETKETFRTT